MFNSSSERLSLLLRITIFEVLATVPATSLYLFQCSLTLLLRQLPPLLRIVHLNHLLLMLMPSACFRHLSANNETLFAIRNDVKQLCTRCNLPLPHVIAPTGVNVQRL